MMIEWANHETDADCTVNPETDLCDGCGVHHGDRCPTCGGRGYHNPDCRYEVEIYGAEG